MLAEGAAAALHAVRARLPMLAEGAAAALHAQRAPLLMLAPCMSAHFAWELQ